MAKRSGSDPVIEEIDVGDEILSWETWEYPPHQRSRTWYLVSGLIGIAIIVGALLSENFLLAIIVVMMAVILLVSHMRQPQRIMIHITTLGVVLGTEFFRYQDIRDFSIVYDPPEIKLLYIDFHRLLHPIVSLPLEDVNPNAVREALLPYAFENLEREEEALTDTLRRVYKL